MIWAPTLVKNIISNYSNLNGDAKKQTIQKNLSVLIDKICSNQLSPREIKLTLQLLNNRIFKEKNELTDQIKAIYDDLNKLASTELSSSISEQLPKNADPILNFIFLCDIDCKDRNGAIINYISKALKEQVPFITTRSLINGVDLEDRSNAKDLQDAILQSKNDWNIYQKGEFIVFLPKSYPFNANDLDLTVESKVEYLNEIFEIPSKRAEIEGFFELFKPGKRVKKRGILSGHGNHVNLGGLNLKHHKVFIQHAEELGFEFLEVSSCLAGDICGSEHHFKKETKTLHPSFPIVMRSVGAFSTHLTTYNSAFHSYFENLDKLLQKEGPRTLSQFKKMVEENVEYQNEDFVNYKKIKFPQKEDSPIGLKPLNPQHVQWIDFSVVRQAQLQKIDSIEIKDQKYVEFFPLEIPLSLHLTKTTGTTSKDSFKLKNSTGWETIEAQNTPVLLSMIPGDACHLIHELKIEGFSLIDLFLYNAQIYKESHSNKTFFIKNLKDHLFSLSNVTLNFNQHAMNLFYSLGIPERYVHYRLNPQTGELDFEFINETDFALQTIWAERRSKPSAEAIRESSGGQENGDLFVDKLQELFWNGRLPKDFELYQTYRKNPSLEKANELIKNLDPLSHQSILREAMVDDEDQLVQILIKDGFVDVNKQNAVGNSIFHNCIRYNKPQHVKLALEQGADLNQPCLQNNETPLMLALEQEEIVKILLEKAKGIDFSIVDKDHSNVLKGYLYNNKSGALITEAIKKFKNFAQLLNNPSKEGCTLLNTATQRKNKKLIEELLLLGADPYAGTLSCLSQAICDLNIEMVEFWLDKGLDCLKTTSGDNSALKIACERGTIEILALILKKMDVRKSFNAPKYLIEMLVAGQFEKASLLLDAGVSVDMDEVKEWERINWKSFIAQVGLYQDPKIIDKLIDHKLCFDSICIEEKHYRAVDLCLNDPSLEFCKQFVKLYKYLIYWSGEKFLSYAYAHKASPEFLKIILDCDIYKKITFIEELVEKNDLETLKDIFQPNLFKGNEGKNLLSEVYKNNYKIFEFFIDKGADPTICQRDEKSLFYQIVEADDEVALDKCLQHKEIDLNQLKGRKLSEIDFRGKESILKKLIDHGWNLELLLKQLLNKPQNVKLLDFVLSQTPKELKSKLLNEEYLKLAANDNNLDLFKVLLNHGVDPLKNQVEGSVISSLLEKGKPQFLKLCLEKGVLQEEILSAIGNRKIHEEAFQILNEKLNQFEFNDKDRLERILKNVKNLDHLKFVLDRIQPEVRESLLNSERYGENYLSQAYDDGDFKRFELLLQYKANMERIF